MKSFYYRINHISKPKFIINLYLTALITLFISCNYNANTKNMLNNSTNEVNLITSESNNYSQSNQNRFNHNTLLMEQNNNISSNIYSYSDNIHFDIDEKETNYDEYEEDDDEDYDSVYEDYIRRYDNNSLNRFLNKNYYLSKIRYLRFRLSKKFKDDITNIWQSYEEKHNTLNNTFLCINDKPLIKSTSIMKIFGGIIIGGNLVIITKYSWDSYIGLLFNNHEILDYKTLVLSLVSIEFSAPLVWWLFDPYLISTKHKLKSIAHTYDESDTKIPCLKNYKSLSRYFDYLPVPYCCRFGEKLLSGILNLFGFCCNNRFVKPIYKPIKNVFRCECKKITEKKI